MSNITKNHKVGIFAIFIASALMLGTISVSGIDSALATGDKHKDNNRGGNGAEQSIEQKQVSKQDSQCVDSTLFNPGREANCNNLAIQEMVNLGSNAIGQK
ncbi:MAG: hypothetical protein WKF36_06105 [Candidatus Nitrosocosmicus sp.]